jgi:hypothetical protein
MAKIYFYKLTVDDGGAPCVTGDLLSLAICKPMIRSTADIDDLIFGFAADSLHKDNRLIYVACVTDKLCDGKYYKDAEYAKRSDCIYRYKGGRYFWKPGSLYHDVGDIEHDLGKYPEYPRANVLLSDDFRYFGKEANAEYKTKFTEVRSAVERLGEEHRVRHTLALQNEFLQMKDWVWETYEEKKIGEPTSEPSRSACHRSKSCGVLKL